MECQFSPCGVFGAMDNASAYGAEDSRFESWRDRYFFLLLFSSSSFQNVIASNKINTNPFHTKMDIIFVLP